MKAEIVYHIVKARPQADETGAPLRWILIRSGCADNGIGYQGLVPEVDAAIFTSEVEANLFAAHLRALESASEKSVEK